MALPAQCQLGDDKGRLTLSSEGHICFAPEGDDAGAINWPLARVVRFKKKKTKRVVPNAIEITVVEQTETHSEGEGDGEGKEEGEGSSAAVGKEAKHLLIGFVHRDKVLHDLQAALDAFKAGHGAGGEEEHPKKRRSTFSSFTKHLPQSLHHRSPSKGGDAAADDNSGHEDEDDNNGDHHEAGKSKGKAGEHDENGGEHDKGSKRHSGGGHVRRKSHGDFVSGEVEVAFHVDTTAMTLLVKVIRGRNLAPKDHSGTSDPRVITHFKPPKSRSSHPKHRRKGKTAAIKKTLDPVWKEEFEFHLDDADIAAIKKKPAEGQEISKIKVVVEDENTITAPDFMGWFSVPITALELNGTVHRWYTLHEKGDKSGAEERGAVIESSPESSPLAGSADSTSSSGGGGPASPKAASAKEASSPKTAPKPKIALAAAKVIAQSKDASPQTEQKKEHKKDAGAGAADQPKKADSAKAATETGSRSPLAGAKGKNLAGSQMADVVADVLEGAPSAAPAATEDTRERAEGEIFVKLRFRAAPSPGDKSMLTVTLVKGRKLEAMDRSGTSA
jgi:C2 domain